MGIAASRGQHSTVGRECNGCDGTLVPLKRQDLFPSTGVPQLHRLVRATRAQDFSVWRKRYGTDRMLVSHQASDFFARPNVPDVDRAVGCADRQCLAVRRVSYGLEAGRLESIFAQVLSVLRLPNIQARRAQRAMPKTRMGGDHAQALWGERDARLDA